MMAVPQAAIDLAKHFEGFYRVPKVDPGRAHPYLCPAGFWTIGYGHLCDPKHPPITVAEAESYLAQDLQLALAATLRYCPVLATEPEGRLAATVSKSAGLGRCWYGAAPMDLWRRESAAGTCHSPGGRGHLADSQHLNQKRPEELAFIPEQRVHGIHANKEHYP
jgi:GH24 family phage-related lysozyme (muramidase)